MLIKWMDQYLPSWQFSRLFSVQFPSPGNIGWSSIERRMKPKETSSFFAKSMMVTVTNISDGPMAEEQDDAQRNTDRFWLRFLGLTINKLRVWAVNKTVCCSMSEQRAKTTLMIRRGPRGSGVQMMIITPCNNLSFIISLSQIPAASKERHNPVRIWMDLLVFQQININPSKGRTTDGWLDRSAWTGQNNQVKYRELWYNV